jgi:hypothetical protein
VRSSENINVRRAPTQNRSEEKKKILKVVYYFLTCVKNSNFFCKRQLKIDLTKKENINSIQDLEFAVCYVKSS